MRRVAVRGIALHKGKLLCTKLRQYSTLTESGAEWWCLPGGTVDEGEDIRKALVREFQEETGVTPVVGNLLYVQQFKHKDTEHVEFFFHIENPDDYLSIDLSKTTHGSIEIESITYVDIDKTIILPKFLTQEDVQSHVDQGRPVKFFQSGT